MLTPNSLFELQGMWRNFFAKAGLVFEALDYLEEFSAHQVEEAGANVALLRKNGDLLTKTHVLHEGKIYNQGFTLLGGDPTKGTMKVLLEGREVSNATVVEAGAILKSDDIHLAPGALVEAGALLKGPTYIGPQTEVRQGAYLRGGCLIGRACVVGHTTEAKNVAMLDEAKAGHFAYLGDSILGNDVNLGAGTKLANLKFASIPYVFKVEGQTFTCQRKKFGAILGDKTQTGCNSVTNPGVIMGPRSIVYPCQAVTGGYYPARSRGAGKS